MKDEKPLRALAQEMHRLSRSKFAMRPKMVAISNGLLTIRNSARVFARAPGLSLVLLLTIALGVGSNITVFGFVQGLMHPSSPAKDKDRIVSIFAQDKTHSAGPLTRYQFQQLRSHPDGFDWIEGARIAPANVDLGGSSEIAIVAAVMPNLASSLSLPQNGGAVLSRRMWEREFGNSVNVVGQRILINNKRIPIIGIAPDRLEGLYRDQIVDIWTLLPVMSSKEQDLRDVWVLARVRDGIPVGEVQQNIRRQLGNSGSIDVVPYGGASPNMARGLSQICIMLEFASVAVFLVACCVVACMLLGRALRRIHIMSITVALGATRLDLVMEVLSDCIVVSLVGGALGLLLAIGTAHILPSLLFAEDAERLVFAPRLDSILLSSLVCIGIIIACGFVPILAATTDRPWNIFRRESALPSRAVARFRTLLIVGQITICCVLTIFTSVLFERFHTLIRTAAGHGVGNLILATVRAQQGLPDDRSFFNTVEKTVKSMPNLSPLAWTTLIPGSRPDWRSFRVQMPTSLLRDVPINITGLPGAPGSPEQRSLWGRPFEARDQSCHVAIVNEEAAETLFGPDTVGMTIQEPGGAPVEIVGVVKGASGHTKEDRRSPAIYYNDSDSSARNRIAGARFRASYATASTSIAMNVNFVSSGYLRALGLSLVGGQWFPEHEVAGDCRRLGVINQEAADLYFGGKAVGAAVIDNVGDRTEIIGIVRSQPLGTFEQHVQPAIYIPIWQEHPSRLTLLIRSSTPDHERMDLLRARIESVPGNDPASPGITMLDTRLVESGLAPLRIAILIFGTSTLTALVLSIFGLLSVQSDNERQRRRELAVRIAFGAQRRHIFFMTIKAIGRLAFAGILVGTLISGAALRAFSTELSTIGSPPFQVWLLAPILSILLLIMTATVAGYRALSGDPQTLMREDG
jgi:putative ABC transport system permease protein